MPLIYESSVFKETYDVLKEMHVARQTFSKSERYSLGEPLERVTLDILLHIIRASQTRQEWRVREIDSALSNLEESKILTRLAHDLRQVDDRRYVHLEASLQKIGRMLGGWRKAA